ncbi:FIMAH domain-containing protein [Metabacillus rhizosphaerae]
MSQIELLGFNDLQEKFDQVESVFKSYVESGEIGEVLKKQLDVNLSQSLEQYQKGYHKQSVKKLGDFSKDIKKNGSISEKAKEQLNADIHTLIEAVTKVINGHNSGIGK